MRLVFVSCSFFAPALPGVVSGRWMYSVCCPPGARTASHEQRRVQASYSKPELVGHSPNQLIHRPPQVHGWKDQVFLVHMLHLGFFLSVPAVLCPERMFFLGAVLFVFFPLAPALSARKGACSFIAGCRPGLPCDHT